MIYAIQDKKEPNLQLQIKLKEDIIEIYPQDLTNDSSLGFGIVADKQDFLKTINAIKFVESGFKASGDLLSIADTVRAMLIEFGFTTPLYDANDRIAYDAFALRILELLEAYKNGNDFQPVEIDSDLVSQIEEIQ